MASAFTQTLLVLFVIISVDFPYLCCTCSSTSHVGILPYGEIIPDSYRHPSDTDVCTIFLSKEKHKLLIFSDNMYGLGLSRFSFTRSSSVSMYAFLVGIEYISHYLEARFFRHNLQRLRTKSSRPIARKIRQYLAARKHTVMIHNIAALLLLLLLCGNVHPPTLLLLCGDIHPNPGPVHTANARHPGLQLLNVATWNVRTLLETKRTTTRPSAIVARELDRYDIDIAAISETRVLGDSVIEEV